MPICQKKSLSEYRRRLKRRGVVRLEVHVRKEMLPSSVVSSRRSPIRAENLKRAQCCERASAVARPRALRRCSSRHRWKALISAASTISGGMSSCDIISEVRKGDGAQLMACRCHDLHRINLTRLGALPDLKMLFRAQGKLHHPFEQLVCRQASEVVHDQLLGVEPHEVAKLQRLAA
jgi:hypothetical protein